MMKTFFYAFFLAFICSAPLAAQSDNIAPLHAAAYHGNLPLLKTYLSEGLPVDAPDAYGYTPLMWAVSKGQNDLARYLIERAKADVHKKAPNGMTALMLAVACNNYELTGLLAVYGADLRSPSSDGNTPLHYAMVGGRRDIIDFLITFGALVDETNARGLFPIEVAAQNGHDDIVGHLLRSGAYTREGAYPVTISDTTTKNIQTRAPSWLSGL